MMKLYFLLFIIPVLASAHFVKDPSANNVALLAGENRGQPLMSEELKIMERLAQSEAMGFKTTVLENETATKENILNQIQKLALEAGKSGTLLFVFDGWSTASNIPQSDKLILNDAYLPVKTVFESIAAGRKELGPLDRFVFLFLGTFTYKTIDHYAKGEFFSSFIGLGMDQLYKVTHTAFENALQKVSAANGTMKDFAIELESNAKSDKARIIYSPKDIELEKL